MKKAPVSRADSILPPLSSGRLTRAALASLMLSSQACAPMQTPPKEAPKTASSISTAIPPNHYDKSPLPKNDIPEDAEFIRITIVGDTPKPWPDVPATCVYTGNVLIHDRFAQPHRILLENMCLQERGSMQNIFEGKHIWSHADSQGHYGIPFRDSHLEERNDQLFFISNKDGHRIEEPLVRGMEPGTLTFKYSLDNNEIRPLVGR